MTKANPFTADFAKLRWTADYATHGAHCHPDRAAIIGDHGALTYRELATASERFAGYLAAQQIGPGTRIAYLGRNSEWFFTVLFGCLNQGVILTPLNWRCTVVEIAYILEDSGSVLLIHDEEFAAIAEQACTRLPAGPARLPVDGDAQGCLQRLLRGDTSPPARHDGSPDQCALLMYTSGTTGRPKGVMLSHRALSVSRHLDLVSPDWRDWDDSDVVLSAMPNFHIGGLAWMLIGLLRSLTCVLTADSSAANIVRLAKRHSVTRTFMVPTVIRSVLDQLRTTGESPPRLRTIYYGAATMDPALLTHSIQALGCGFAQFFGMTENCGVAAFLPPSAHDLHAPNLLRSVGKALAGMAIEIRDPSGRRLSANEAGEIWIRSPTLMSGYWNRPDATAECLVDGWYRSGDGGYLDEMGYLFLTDRIKDMIISGGENIYPAEVEDALRRHPAVRDVVVVGVPDMAWGESVVAVVEWKDGRCATLQALRATAERHIASFKLPKLLHEVTALPRTATGKLQRAEVRRQTIRLVSDAGA